MRIRPCVVIQKEEKILLLHYKYGNSDVYGIPGGSPDPGETLEDTVIRESKEELSIDISVDKLLFMGEIVWPDNRKSVLNCIFLGQLKSGVPTVNSSHSTAPGFIWAPIKELGEMNLYPNIGERIFHASKNGYKNNDVYIGKINQKWF